MHHTLYSESTCTGKIQQQNVVALQMPLPDSGNELNSSQITTTDSVAKKLKENAKLNFPSENKKRLLYNRKYSTEQNREMCTKILKIETEKNPFPDLNDLNKRTYNKQVKIDRLPEKNIKTLNSLSPKLTFKRFESMYPEIDT